MDLVNDTALWLYILGANTLLPGFSSGTSETVTRPQDLMNCRPITARAGAAEGYRGAFGVMMINR